MLEKGHFEELQRILEKINENENNVKKRQNFVFSATLTLTHEPPRYVMKKKSKRKAIQESARLTPAQKLASIMNTVGLTDPKVVDITEASGLWFLLYSLLTTEKLRIFLLIETMLISNLRCCPAAY